MNSKQKFKEKFDNLIEFLKNKKVIVDFSGGVDSSLLAYLANKYAQKSLSVTFKTVLISDEEIEEAKGFAEAHRINHEIIQFDLLKNEELLRNPINRCYLCKLTLYDNLISILKKRDFDLILDGTNTDDLQSFRPGFEALKELGINTPYIQFNITKEDIRKMSKNLDLKTYSKPSMACLASRIPYGEEISEELIKMIREAENFLRLEFKLSQLRVRTHAKNLVRIEILKEEFDLLLKMESLSLITQKLKDIGFKYVTLDLEGFRSGSMDEVIDSEIKSTLNKSEYSKR